MGNDESVKNVLRRISGRVAEHGSFAVIYATALLVLLAGLWAVKQAGADVELRMRRDLISQVSGVAATINPFNLRALSYTADDKSRPEFHRLCDQMYAYAQIAGIDSLYTMALRNGKIVFGPESPANGDPQALRPGTVYQKPSAGDYEFFKTGSPQIQGPRTDEYGTFLTALAPVLDPRTGEVLAAVGIDVEVSAWKSAVWRAQWTPAILTLVLLLVLLLIRLALKHRRSYSPRRHERRRFSEIILCAGFFTLLTVLLVVHVNQGERAARRDTFRQLAQAHAAACTREFYDLRNRLDQLVYFFESSQDVTRDEFAFYCKHLVEQGILEACVWLPAVPDTEAGSFVKTVRASGLPDFSIWQKNQAGVNEPAAHRPVYYPALYIEPLAGHAAGLGYDLNSEPTRSAAMQDALSAGLATATDPVRLIALTNSPSGIFIFAPVHASVQKGLVAFAIRPENLLGGAQHSGKRIPDVRVCLIQLQNGKDPLFVAGSSSQCGLSCLKNTESDMAVTIPVFRFGKAYVLRLVPDPFWLAAHPLRHGWMAGCFGLMLTLLVSSIVALVINRRSTLEKLIDRRTAELKASEQNFRMLTESMPQMVWAARPDGWNIYINQQWVDYTGMTLEESLGHGWSIPFHPADRQRAQDVWKNATQNDKPYSIECRLRRADGAYRWWLIRGAPLRDEDGKILKWFGTCTDIENIKEAEAAVEREQEFTHTLLDNIADGVVACDSQGKLVLFNRAAREWHGMDALASPPEDWSRHYSLYESDETTPLPTGSIPLVRAFRGEHFNNVEIVIAAKGQPIRHVQCAGAPFFDARNNLLGAVVVMRDVTEQKRAEEALRMSQQLTERIINTIPVRVFWKDRNLVYLGCNAAFAQDAGFAAPSDVVGKEDDQMVWRDQAELYRKDDREVIERGTGKFLIEELMTRPDGKTATVLTTKVPLRDAAGEICGMLGTYIDITERKEVEEKLKQKYDELDRFNRVTVGREIRMIELKKEINGLLKAAGQPEKYVIAGEAK